MIALIKQSFCSTSSPFLINFLRVFAAIFPHPPNCKIWIVSKNNSVLSSSPLAVLLFAYKPKNTKKIEKETKRVKNKQNYNYGMVQETVTIPREEYEKLKRQAEIDIDLLEQFLESFKDIKEGRFRRVK